MGNIWKSRSKCRGFPEMFRMFPMNDESDRQRFRRMQQCMNVIRCYGQRYGCYFAPEFVVHSRRHGDPFQNVHSSHLPFPSGGTFNAYLYAREMMYRQQEEESDFVIDLSSELDYDQGAPEISLSSIYEEDYDE